MINLFYGSSIPKICLEVLLSKNKSLLFLINILLTAISLIGKRKMFWKMQLNENMAFVPIAGNYLMMKKIGLIGLFPFLVGTEVITLLTSPFIFKNPLLFGFFIIPCLLKAAIYLKIARRCFRCFNQEKIWIFEIPFIELLFLHCGLSMHYFEEAPEIINPSSPKYESPFKEKPTIIDVD